MHYIPIIDAGIA